MGQPRWAGLEELYPSTPTLGSPRQMLLLRSHLVGLGVFPARFGIDDPHGVRPGSAYGGGELASQNAEGIDDLAGLLLAHLHDGIFDALGVDGR